MNEDWNSPEIRWAEWKADLDRHMVNDERDSSIIREYVQDYELEALGMERYKESTMRTTVSLRALRYCCKCYRHPNHDLRILWVII